MRNFGVGGMIVALLLSSIAPTSGQETVGSVAALEGRGEVRRRGAESWVAIAPGDDVLLGDELRTLDDSRMKILFRDDSVLTLAANSQLTVNQQTTTGAPVSYFSLLMGVVRALCTERYSEAGARFELETPTAVAGVRGTGFIATYDGNADETRVVGLFDTTTVRSQVDSAGTQMVELGPGDTTSVMRGRYPHAPTRMPDDVLRGLVGSTEIAAGGAAAGGSPAPSRAAKAADPRLPGRSGTRSTPGERDVVDQPLEILNLPGGGKGPPPPPPIP